MKESGYRLNVGLVIANQKGQLLLCKRTGMNSWQFPQGGIDYAEEPLKAAKRELYEEVGIKSNSVKLIHSLEDWLKYNVPKKSRRRKLINKNFKGQKVNPVGLRLGINRGWDSVWYAKKKDFGNYLIEDFKIREYIKKNVVNSGVSKVMIERTAKKC